MSNFRKALILDWETSGIPDPFALEPYISGPQGFSFGACVVDDIDYEWEIVDEFSAHVKWLGPDPEVDAEPDIPTFTWNEQAFSIHGLSRPFLRNMPTPEELASPFNLFVTKHFNSYNKIVLGAYNPAFDMYFTRQFLLLSNLLEDRSIQFSHRTLDLFTAGYFAFTATKSDELFELISGTKRETHGALEDARLAVEGFRAVTQYYANLV